MHFTATLSRPNTKILKIKIKNKIEKMDKNIRFYL